MKQISWKTAGVWSGVLLSCAAWLGLSMENIGAQYARATNMLVGWMFEDNMFLSIYAQSEWMGFGFMMAVGLILGAWMSHMMTNTQDKSIDSSLWQTRRGGSRRGRYMFAFVGGIFAMLGVMMASTSLISGAMYGVSQLSVSSSLFVLAVFAAGTPVAAAMFSQKGGK